MRQVQPTSPPSRAKVLGLCIICFWLSCLPQTDAAEQWEVDGVLYEQVEVREITPESVVIRHRRGIGSIPLQNLPPALQERFAYDPDAAAAHREAQAARSAEAAQLLQKQRQLRRQRSPAALAAESVRPLDRALASLRGQGPEIAEEVDLRHLFFDFGLYARDQSFRPSCSIFAISTALEYALAVAGQSEQLSEEYLIWATLQYLERHPEPLNRPGADTGEPGDIGFSLSSVVHAAQWFGVASQEEMPNTRGDRISDIVPPPPDLIDRSKARRSIRAAAITGRDRSEQIDHIIHLLNHQWPVVIGMDWPSASTMRERPLIHGQSPIPGYAHAVTLVGYISPEQSKEEIVFIFRNSWGINWGIHGHGMVSREYLLEHLKSAMVLDVEAK